MAKELVKDSVFAQLNEINVNGHTEKKKTGSTELTYLSWSWAWTEVKKRFPDATYTIYKDGSNRPFIEDADFGLMCYTTVTIDGMTHEMWLPVMDGANKAMKRTAYSYKVMDYKSRQYVDKWVQPATMFDINKTIMRCLVKNLAMFGLGLYIYAGEDLPESPDDTPSGEEKKAETPKPEQDPANHEQQLLNDEYEEAFMLIKANIEKAPSKQYLADIYNQNPGLRGYQPFMDALSKRKKEVEV